MTVLVANDTPPAVRGLLKRWFIEPKANVFVGTVNRRTRARLIEYVRRHAPDLGLLVIANERNAQGFVVETFGDTKRRLAEKTGLQLIAEKWAGSEGGNPDDPETSPT